MRRYCFRISSLTTSQNCSALACLSGVTQFSSSQDVDQLRGQISSSSISVEMDNRKGEDLNETINKIRNDYEKAALKSREDTEAWYQSKVGLVEQKIIIIVMSIPSFYINKQ